MSDGTREKLKDWIAERRESSTAIRRLGLGRGALPERDDDEE